jgi:hypothetical protein
MLWQLCSFKKSYRAGLEPKSDISDIYTSAQNDFITLNHGSQWNTYLWRYGKQSFHFPYQYHQSQYFPFGDMLKHQIHYCTDIYSCLSHSCKVIFSNFAPPFCDITDILRGWEVGGTGSGSCTMACFGIGSVEALGLASRDSGWVPAFRQTGFHHNNRSVLATYVTGENKFKIKVGPQSGTDPTPKMLYTLLRTVQHYKDAESYQPDSCCIYHYWLLTGSSFFFIR